MNVARHLSAPSSPPGGGIGPVRVLLNPQSGPAPADAGRLLGLMQSTGLDAEVLTAPPNRLTEMAREAAGDGRVVVAAGGDGTVAAVAASVAGSHATLGVLPIGTSNHFARDLGLPATLPQAISIIAAGHVRAVDVGEVNGRLFLNNSSIGMYPRIVHRREGQRQRLGRGRWLAMGLAIVRVFRRYPLVHVIVQTPQRTFRCATPIAFVGNNRYQMNLLNLGGRLALDRGELSLYLANSGTRLDFLLLALRALVGRLNQARDFETITATRLRIETRKRKLRVALDGEVVRMRPPLEFRIRPGALRVLTP